MRTAASLLLLPPLLGGLSGCAGEEKYREESAGRAAGPLYREESVELGGAKFAQRDAAWPLYHEEHDEKTGLHSYSVRPLFHYSYDDAGELDQTLGVWPFAFFRKRPDQDRRWVLPFYYSSEDTDIEGVVDSDNILLFPFFWWGTKSGVQEEAEEQGFESDRGDYFAFLPFYGHLKGYLGKDNFRFIMFPVYWNANDRDYESEGFFWPGGWFEGEGSARKVSSRFPWYGSSERYGHYRRNFYAWPFVHTAENYLDTPYPEDTFLAWPFYGEARSEGRLAQQYLWPFFNFLDDERGDYHAVDAPWPFFGTLEGPQARAFRIWPLYGFQEDVEGYRRDFALWPLFWRWQDDTKYYQKTAYLFGPIFKSEEYTYHDGSESSALRIWPLFDYQKDQVGIVRHRSLVFFPFDDFEPQGFEKLWQPLVGLYGYEESAERGSWLQVLGPTYERRDAPEVYSERVLFFEYSAYHETGLPPGERYSFLGGMFEWIEREDDSGFRLFWLPPIGMEEDE